MTPPAKTKSFARSTITRALCRGEMDEDTSASHWWRVLAAGGRLGNAFDPRGVQVAPAPGATRRAAPRRHGVHHGSAATSSVWIENTAKPAGRKGGRSRQRRNR